MSQQIRLMLSWEFSEAASRNLALEYWQQNADGTWSATVQEIAVRYGLPKQKVPEKVREAVVAYDLMIRCSDCSSPRELSSRSDVSSSYGLSYVCPACVTVRTQKRLAQEEEARRAEADHKRELVLSLCEDQPPFDYCLIDYRDAIIAYAIMQHSESAMVDGHVGDVIGLGLCHNNLLSKLLGQLHNSGILLFRPDTPLDAISTNSVGAETISYFPSKVWWRFAPADDGETFSAVFRRLGEIIDGEADHPDSQKAVAELWWMLGRDDAYSYLEEQLASYRLSGYKPGPKTDEAISYALNRFSIPQLRYLLYRVAKNAAALSTRREFNRQHALNTIPGSLMRDCDRALADHWTIKPYVRKWDEEEPRLITVLFDRVLGQGVAGFKCMTGASLQETSEIGA